MLFEPQELERVLRLQQQSYGLLKWMNQHLKSGSLSFNVVHGAMSGPASAEEWLVRNRRIFRRPFFPRSQNGVSSHICLLHTFLHRLRCRLRKCARVCRTAYQLTRRTEFASQGCAVLVLWRDIAWEDGRKPRENFELTAARVLQSEQTLRSALSAMAGER